MRANRMTGRPEEIQSSLLAFCTIWTMEICKFSHHIPIFYVAMLAISFVPVLSYFPNIYDLNPPSYIVWPTKVVAHTNYSRPSIASPCIASAFHRYVARLRGHTLAIYIFSLLFFFLFFNKNPFHVYRINERIQTASWGRVSTLHHT